MVIILSYPFHASLVFSISGEIKMHLRPMERKIWMRIECLSELITQRRQSVQFWRFHFTFNEKLFIRKEQTQVIKQKSGFASLFETGKTWRRKTSLTGSIWMNWNPITFIFHATSLSYLTSDWHWRIIAQIMSDWLNVTKVLLRFFMENWSSC